MQHCLTRNLRTISVSRGRRCQYSHVFLTNVSWYLDCLLRMGKGIRIFCCRRIVFRTLHNRVLGFKAIITLDHQYVSEGSTFSDCDCSHVTASNQSGRVATVSCSQSAASLQNNRKQFATKLLIRYRWLWLPTRIGCLRSRDYSRSQKK